MMRTPRQGSRTSRSSSLLTIGSGRECELEILIVLWITAIGDQHGRLKPDGSMPQYFQDPLTPRKRDCTRKPGAVENPGNLGIDRGRESEHIDFLGNATARIPERCRP
jgi:hypothetical protein